MTITFNGKVFAGFVVGVLVGVGVAALSARHVYADQAQAKEVAIRRAFYEDFGLKGDIQPALDKMDIWTLFSEAGKEFQVRANVIQQLSARQRADVPAAATAQSADDQVFSTLNKIYPGWGTASKIAKTFLDQHQAQRTTQSAVTAQPQSQPLVSTALSGSCAPNGLLINGQCSQCNPGLHPGLFPDGSAG